MPTLAATGCLEPRCPARAVFRGRCRAHATAHEQLRGTRSERGYDDDWLRLRARHLRLHPFCQFDACHGKRTPATQVDHRVPHRDAPHRRLDPTNLRSACDSCHGRYGAKATGGRGFEISGSNGKRTGVRKKTVDRDFKNLEFKDSKNSNNQTTPREVA